MEISVFTRYNECAAVYNTNRRIDGYSDTDSVFIHNRWKYGREKTPETQTGNGNSGV